jgi:uncharacterized membrane protein YbhN (UPF0104 family)
MRKYVELIISLLSVMVAFAFAAFLIRFLMVNHVSNHVAYLTIGLAVVAIVFICGAGAKQVIGELRATERKPLQRSERVPAKAA